MRCRCMYRISICDCWCWWRSCSSTNVFILLHNVTLSFKSWRSLFYAYNATSSREHNVRPRCRTSGLELTDARDWRTLVSTSTLPCHNRDMEESTLCATISTRVTHMKVMKPRHRWCGVIEQSENDMKVVDVARCFYVRCLCSYRRSVEFSTFGSPLRSSRQQRL